MFSKSQGGFISGRIVYSAHTRRFCCLNLLWALMHPSENSPMKKRVEKEEFLPQSCNIYDGFCDKTIRWDFNFKWVASSGLIDFELTLMIRLVPILTQFCKLPESFCCCQHKLGKKLTFSEWLLPHYMILGGEVLFSSRMVNKKKQADTYGKLSVARKTLRLWKSFLPPKAVSHLVFPSGRQKIIFRKNIQIWIFAEAKVALLFFLSFPQLVKKVFCFLNFSIFSPSKTSSFFFLQGTKLFSLVSLAKIIWFLVTKLFLFTFTQILCSHSFKWRVNWGWFDGNEKMW